MTKLFLSVLAAWTALNAYSEDLSENHGLQFNVILEKKIYKAGQPFIANLEFINTTQKNMGLYIGTHSVGISVHDESGEKIITQACDLEGMVMTVLGPEEKYTEISVDLKDQLPVLRGKYSIQLAYAFKSDLSGQGFQFTDGDQWKGMVESNKVLIEVEE